MQHVVGKHHIDQRLCVCVQPKILIIVAGESVTWKKRGKEEISTWVRGHKVPTSNVFLSIYATAQIAESYFDFLNGIKH